MLSPVVAILLPFRLFASSPCVPLPLALVSLSRSLTRTAGDCLKMKDFERAMIVVGGGGEEGLASWSLKERVEVLGAHHDQSDDHRPWTGVWRPGQRRRWPRA
jgi:hypothetical protein